MAPEGSGSRDDDKPSNDPDPPVADGSTKRKQKSGKKAKSELMVDLSDPDGKIVDTIRKVRKNCWSWLAKPLRKAPPRNYELEPLAARIVDGAPLFDEALHDFTAFAIRSYHCKDTCTKYTHDFEVGKMRYGSSRVVSRRESVVTIINTELQNGMPPLS